MGNALYRPPAGAVDSSGGPSAYRTIVFEYSQNLIYNRLLNAESRFMRSVHVKCNGGGLVIKVYMKIDVEEDLEPYQAMIRSISDCLSLERQPNLLPYQDWKFSPRSGAAFLVRQYFYANLADRMNMRPFLCNIEKRWIAFQLLRALDQMHALGICHGDVKSENIMVTSWGWIFLTGNVWKRSHLLSFIVNWFTRDASLTADFACFKPVYIPEDNPAYFYYYFSSSGSRRCTLAPERFFKSSIANETTFLNSLQDSAISVDEVHRQAEVVGATLDSGTAFRGSKPGTGRPSKGGLDPAMDIFGAGCVIGFLFLGDAGVFDYPALLAFRAGQSDIPERIKKLDDKRIRTLLESMLQRDPRRRKSAAMLLAENESQEGLFPPAFRSFLFPFMRTVLDTRLGSADTRIRVLCKYYGLIVKELAGVEDQQHDSFFKQCAEEWFHSCLKADNYDCEDGTHAENDDGTRHMTNCENLEARLDALFRRIDATEELVHNCSEPAEGDGTNNLKEAADQLHEVLEDVGSPQKSSFSRSAEDNAIVIVLSLICSTIRHVLTAHTKSLALVLLVRLAAFTDDETRLQRLVPFTVSLLGDRSAIVRTAALRSLSSLLAMINDFSASDISIFPQYIFPALSRFSSDPHEMVRIAFARCLPRLAENSRRFLDIAHAKQMEGSFLERNAEGSRRKRTNTKSGNIKENFSIESYDKELTHLQEVISRFLVRLAAPDQRNSSSLVKRALLTDITRLCIFFGRERTLDLVLPQLITFLNDRDWELRSAFFQYIPGSCAFVGRLSLEQYILPCIEQALIDVQEVVIARALQCLSTLCSLGLFQRNTLIDKVSATAPLLFHPGWWIRNSVVGFLASVARRLGDVDSHAFLLPLLVPYVKEDLGPQSVDETYIRHKLRSPVPREVFDEALIGGKSRRPDTGKRAGRTKKVQIPQGTETRVREAGFESFIDVAEAPPSISNAHEGWTRLDENPLGEAEDNTSAREDGAGASAPGDATAKSSFDDAVQDKDCDSKLQIMHKYVEAAARHMSSKLVVAGSEHSAWLKGKISENISRRGEEQNPRRPGPGLLHILRVPDQRFAGVYCLATSSEEAELARDGTLTLRPPAGRALSGASPAVSRVPQRTLSYEGPSAAPREFRKRRRGLEIVFQRYGAHRSVADPRSMGPLGVDDDTSQGIPIHSSGSPVGTESAIATTTLLKPLKRGLQVGRPDAQDSAFRDSRAALARIRALGVPPLPPDMGVLMTPQGFPYSIYDKSGRLQGSSRDRLGAGSITAGTDLPSWKPKSGVLMAETSCSSGAVKRLAVCQDHSFFASGAMKGVVEIYSLRRFLQKPHVKSDLALFLQDGPLTDMVLCDNSHSIATSTERGVIDVFKVESHTRVRTGRGLAAIYHKPVTRTVCDEGAILCMAHRNTSTESVLVYATQEGKIHGWDLRTRQEAWMFAIGPEFGSITAVSIGTDGLWVVVGTLRGYLCLWDVRFHLVVKIWRHTCHAIIHRIEQCVNAPPFDSIPHFGASTPSLPTIFVAAGVNETSVVDLGTGICRMVFRTLQPQATETMAFRVPLLEPVEFRQHGVCAHMAKLNTHGRLEEMKQGVLQEPSVRAILAPSLDTPNIRQCVITAGTDRHIRFWDLKAPQLSMTVSNVTTHESSREYFVGQIPNRDWWKNVADWSKAPWRAQRQAVSLSPPPLVYLCQDAWLPTSTVPYPGTSPRVAESRGAVPAFAGHKDCILDLKLVDVGVPMILSASRDGGVKLWR